MNEVKTQIIATKIGQRLLQSRFNIIWMVHSVPELAGYEQILALNGAVAAEYIAKRASNLLLVAINSSTIQVAVSQIDCSVDGSTDNASIGFPST